MKSQGARFVIETWTGGDKALFSGLIHYRSNIYYGDNKSLKTGRKSFIIALLNGEVINLIYFNSFSLFPKERPKFLCRFTQEVLAKNPGNKTK